MEWIAKLFIGSLLFLVWSALNCCSCCLLSVSHNSCICVPTPWASPSANTFSSSSLPTSSILSTITHISSCCSSANVTSLFSYLLSFILSLFLYIRAFCFCFNWLAGDIFARLAFADGACLLIFLDGLSDKVHFLCQSRSVFRRLHAEHITSLAYLSTIWELIGS